MDKKRHQIQKIGIYDSGLGGLFVLSKLYKAFPGYEYVFLGDEKNLPYGTKTIPELFSYARLSIDFLLNTEKCDLVIIACNTLSATVYQELQKQYAQSHPDQLLIDVITPTIDSLKEDTSYVIFGTYRTIESHVYKNEIQNIFPNSFITECTTSELASLIEKKEDTFSYIQSIKKNIPVNQTTCILGCTHYGLVERVIQKVFPTFKKIVRQDSVIIDLMRFVLDTKKKPRGTVSLYVTKDNPVFDAYAKEWFGRSAIVKIIEL